MDYYYTEGGLDIDNTTEIPFPSPAKCQVHNVFYQNFTYIALALSGFVIVLLVFLEKRNDPDKCAWAGQRPGMIFPVNLLDEREGSFGYAVAFGSMASVVWNLFWQQDTLFAIGPTWAKSLLIMVTVLYFGLLYYPMFACLTTTWVFMGSFLGLGYTILWFVYYLITVVKCPSGEDETNLPGHDIAIQLPSIVCLLLLMMTFVFRFVRHAHRVIRSRSDSSLFRRNKREQLSSAEDVMYLRQLLAPINHDHLTDYVGDMTPSRTSKIRSFCYRWLYRNDPTFRYSPRIICIFTVAIISAYQFGILIVMSAYQIRRLIPYLVDPMANDTGNAAVLEQVRLAVNILENSLIVSFVIASLITLFSIFLILTNYRNNIRLMYKGHFKHLPFQRNTRHAQFIMSDSMSYAGSQIAYLLWGYIVMVFSLLITCFIVAYLIVLPIFHLIPVNFLQVIGNVLPGLVIMQVFYLLQKVYVRGLLQKRDKVNKKGKHTTKPVLALNNRKMYHNASYFLFIFYIILGVFGCFMTIVKGVVLGVFFLARLDMCGLLPGFETWDKGYMFYVSFLHVEECHRHPVMRVFCDLLIDGVRRTNVPLRQYGTSDNPSMPIDSSSGSSYGTEDSLVAGNGIEQSPPSTNGNIFLTTQSSCFGFQALAKRRWFKAYTLIKNPSLVEREIADDYDMLHDIEVDV